MKGGRLDGGQLREERMAHRAPSVLARIGSLLYDFVTGEIADLAVLRFDAAVPVVDGSSRRGGWEAAMLKTI